jgi:hypothetical protein
VLCERIGSVMPNDRGLRAPKTTNYCTFIGAMNVNVRANVSRKNTTSDYVHRLASCVDVSLTASVRILL